VKLPVPFSRIRLGSPRAVCVDNVYQRADKGDETYSWVSFRTFFFAEPRKEAGAPKEDGVLGISKILGGKFLSGRKKEEDPDG